MSRTARALRQKLRGAADSGPPVRKYLAFLRSTLHKVRRARCTSQSLYLSSNSAAMAGLLKTMLGGSGGGKDGMRRTGSFDDLSMGAGRDGMCIASCSHLDLYGNKIT